MTSPRDGTDATAADGAVTPRRACVETDPRTTRLRCFERCAKTVLCSAIPLVSSCAVALGASSFGDIALCIASWATAGPLYDVWSDSR